MAYSGDRVIYLKRVGDRRPSQVALVERKLPASAGDIRDADFIPGSEDAVRRKWQPTPVFLPGESHGQKSLAGYSLWGRKESGTTEPFNTTHVTEEHNREKMQRSIFIIL